MPSGGLYSSGLATRRTVQVGGGLQAHEVFPTHTAGAGLPPSAANNLPTTGMWRGGPSCVAVCLGVVRFERAGVIRTES